MCNVQCAFWFIGAKQNFNFRGRSSIIVISIFKHKLSTLNNKIDVRHLLITIESNGKKNYDQNSALKCFLLFILYIHMCIVLCCAMYCFFHWISSKNKIDDRRHHMNLIFKRILCVNRVRWWRFFFIYS